MKTVWQEAATRREPFLRAGGRTAFRLIDGFRETGTKITVEVFGSTLVLLDYRREAADDTLLRDHLQEARALVPFAETAVWKPRHREGTGERIWGEAEAESTQIEEDGVRYSVPLLSHKDAGFFLDTRHLRSYLRGSCAGMDVLNTFAYTSSLSVAAASGGANVVSTDKNKAWLNVGKASFSLNGLAVRRADFKVGDHFEIVRRLRTEGRLFDVVVLDPPFFAEGDKGTVDVEARLGALVDKVRPLVADGGRLVVVVNALFLSGAAVGHALQPALESGYVTLEERLTVPDDVNPPGAPFPADPTPFSHPTKIAVLRLRRKDGRGRKSPRV